MSTKFQTKAKTKTRSHRIKRFTPRSPEQRRAETERRAFQLYVERGRISGHEMEDWLQAEREIFERDEGEKFD